jgi:hypothetical protein
MIHDLTMGCVGCCIDVSLSRQCWFHLMHITMHGWCSVLHGCVCCRLHQPCMALCADLHMYCLLENATDKPKSWHAAQASALLLCLPCI